MRRLTYPVVTTSACVGFAVMIASGFPAPIAAAAAVSAGLGLIVASESRWPYRRSWHPNRAVLTSDAAYAVTVQMVLPAALTIAYAVIASTLGSSGWELWPHSLPAVAQVILMVVVADLLRYPLHRAMHSSPSLWRLHAVHHSPDRLYWLNVGRFHPVEKMLQGALDALPFVLVGVDERVLVGYLVFYAVNGFFQHSNCDVELGPLNYLISGPELHRWHHSLEPAERSSNFGNNLIIWDVLFRTRLLPTDREIDAIGNGDPDYPQGFLDSLRRPFA